VVEVEAGRHQNLLQVVPPVRDGVALGYLHRHQPAVGYVGGQAGGAPASRSAHAHHQDVATRHLQHPGNSGKRKVNSLLSLGALNKF